MERRYEIISELQTNLEEIVDLFTSLNAEQLAATLYEEDPGWSVQQLLAHFITIERSMQWLFKNMLAGGPGSPEDFDFKRFNRTQPRKYDGQPLDALIETFKTVRQDTIAIVAAMEDKDLDREGRHVFHGHGKLERFVVWAYEHARLHLDDVRARLKLN